MSANYMVCIPPLLTDADNGNDVSGQDSPYFSKLKYLRFDSNNIQSLDPSLYRIRSLTYLDLSRNELSSISSEIKKLVKLKHLFLSYNTLVEIPHDFSGLDELKLLNLSNNLLQSILESLKRMKQLQSLDISKNKLDFIPPSLFNSGLKQFIFKQNPLRMFPRPFRTHQITYPYRPLDFIDYILWLLNWDPNQAISEVKNNQNLSSWYKYNYKLGPHLDFILNEIKDIDNETKNQFVEMVNTKYCVYLAKSKSKILL